MTDDEVQQWLTPSERDDFRYARRIREKENYEPHYNAIVALAETRAALLVTEWSGGRDSDACHHCRAYRAGWENVDHDEGCIFATMPRPVKP